MAYVVHEFQSGEVLMAGQLNEMDAQIASNESAASDRSYIAAAYSVTPYSKGSLVVYGGEIWEAVIDITAAEAWNPVHWKQATVNSRIEELNEDAIGLREDADSLREDADYLLSSNGGKSPAIYDSPVSGSIVSFDSNTEDMPLKSLSVSVDPVQDLHGYDNPWPAGGGKNLANIQNASITSQTDIGTVELAAGTYAASFTATNSTSIVGYLRIINGSTTYVSVNIAANASNARLNGTFTLDSATTVTVRCNGASVGYSFSVADVQIESGSSATAYAPYSNICPISGHSTVTVTRTGRNVLPMSLSEMKTKNTGGSWSNNVYTNNGVTFTVQQDESGAVTGILVGGNQATGNTFFNFCFVNSGVSGYLVAGRSYKMSGCPSGGGNNTYRLQITDGRTTKIDSGSGVTFTPDSTFVSANQYYVAIRIPSGYTASNILFKPMIQLATDSDTMFVPYQGISVTIQLGQTVYGGTLDAVAGTLTVDRAIVDLGALSYGKDVSVNRFNSTGISNAVQSDTTHSIAYCSMYKLLATGETSQRKTGFTITAGNGIYIYDSTQENATTDEFKAHVSGQYVCYEITNPTTITGLDQATIKTILGLNNVFASTGDIAVEYPLDTKNYIDSKNEETVTNLSGDITDLKSAFALEEETIQDTVQTIAFDASGNVQSITHTRNNVAVRTDVFTFGANTITEVRTLSTGESLTIVTNTDTLVTTITYADVA